MVGQSLLYLMMLNQFKKHMDAFVDGEMFEATEKLHGTQTRFIFTKGITHPRNFW